MKEMEVSLGFGKKVALYITIIIICVRSGVE